MAKRNLPSALAQVSSFISSLTGVALAPTEAEFDLSFTADGGGLSLTKGEAAAYRECLNNLYASLPQPDLITKREVEKLFQRSLVQALTFQDKTVSTSKAQLANAIGALKAALTASPQRFEIYYPVVGLDPDGLPGEVGLYRFLIFGSDEFDRFSGTQADIANSWNATRRALVQAELDKEIIGAAVAYREVEALEPYAARDRALNDLRSTIDVVNFFSDLIPNNRAHLSLPGDRDGASVTVPIRHLESKSRLTVSRQRVGRIGAVSLKKLYELDGPKQVALTKVNDLLRSERNKMENVFLASVRWAGRATASDRNEEAFLLFIIALESLILSDQDPRELSYRFRLRVAHLLGESFEGRKEIAKIVTHLYNIRSSIVHNGHYEVSDADLGLMRLAVKNCIVTLANDDEFWTIKSPKEGFGPWIENRILA